MKKAKEPKLNLSVRCTPAQHLMLSNEARAKQISVSKLIEHIIFAGYYGEFKSTFINKDKDK